MRCGRSMDSRSSGGIFLRSSKGPVLQRANPPAFDGLGWASAILQGGRRHGPPYTVQGLSPVYDATMRCPPYAIRIGLKVSVRYTAPQ